MSLDVDFTSLSTGAVSTPSGLTYTRASTATVQTSDATVVVGVANDTLRIGQRTSSSTTRGAVIEESRKNIIFQSRDIQNASWTSSGVVTLTGSTTGPDGSTAANRAAIASGSNGRFQTRTTTANISVVYSQWIKGNGNTANQCYVDDSAGLVSGNVDPATVSTTAWSRKTAATCRANASSGSVTVGPHWGGDLSGSGGLTAHAEDAYFDLMQAEVTAADGSAKFPTEAIVTTTAAATRAACRLYSSSLTGLVQNGVLDITLTFIPKGASSEYVNGDPYFYYIDASNYAQYVVSTNKLKVVTGGVSWTSTVTFTWARYDIVVLQIIAGGGGKVASLATVQKNGGSVTDIVNGAVISSATLASSGTIDYLSNGSSNHLSAWLQRITIFAPTLTAAKGTFTETGNAAGLSVGHTLTAARGVFTETGNAAAFTVGHTALSLTAATGTFTETGNAAALSVGHTVTAARGVFTETGNAAAFEISRTLTAARGTFTETGNAAGLSIGHTVAAAKGTFTETGNAAAFEISRTLTAASGTFTETGNAAAFEINREDVASQGAFALTGNAATFRIAHTLTAAKGTFTETGNDATLTYAPAGTTAYSLTAAAGTFALNGQDAALSSVVAPPAASTGGGGGGRRAIFYPGVYREPARVPVAHVMGAVTGTFAVTGGVAACTYQAAQRLRMLAKGTVACRSAATALVHARFDAKAEAAALTSKLEALTAQIAALTAKQADQDAMITALRTAPAPTVAPVSIVPVPAPEPVPEPAPVVVVAAQPTARARERAAAVARMRNR